MRAPPSGRPPTAGRTFCKENDDDELLSSSRDRGGDDDGRQCRSGAAECLPSQYCAGAVRTRGESERRGQSHVANLPLGTSGRGERPSVPPASCRPRIAPPPSIRTARCGCRIRCTRKRCSRSTGCANWRRNIPNGKRRSRSRRFSPAIAGSLGRSWLERTRGSPASLARRSTRPVHRPPPEPELRAKRQQGQPQGSEDRPLRGIHRRPLDASKNPPSRHCEPAKRVKPSSVDSGLRGIMDSPSPGTVIRGSQ